MIRSKSLLLNNTKMQHLGMYICISVSIIILLFPIYLIAFNNSKKIISQEQSQQISQGFQELQSSIEQCNNHAYDLICNENIVRLSQIDNSNPRLALYMYHITLYQQNTHWENDLVKEVIVQFKRNDTLLTQSSVYKDKSSFYLDFFIYENLSYEELQQSLFDENKEYLDTTHIFYKDEDIQAFTLNYYYPSRTSPYIIVSYIIPTEKLFSMLLTDKIREYGDLQIIFNTDNDSLDLSYSSNYESGVPLLTLESSQPSITLKANLSPTAFYHSVASIRNTMIIYILLSFVIAIILSIVFTQLNMKPLKGIVKFISQLGIQAEYNQKNIYAYIRQALSGISLSENQSKKAYQIAQKSLEHIVFDSAINGLSIDTNNLVNSLNHIPAFKSAYLMACIYIKPRWNDLPSNYNPDVAMSITKSLFLQRFQQPYLYESEILYAVMNLSLQGGKECFSEILDEIQQILSDKYKIETYIGLSKEYSDFENLSVAAYQANNALERILTESSRISWYGDLASVPMNIVSFKEEFFFNLLTKSNKESIRLYFDDLIIKVCCEKNVSLQVTSTYYRILSVLQKIINIKTKDDKFLLKEYNPNISTISNFTYLLEMSMQINNAVLTHESKYKHDMVKEILDYLHTNYSSVDLCLTMVADYFNLSERYLSSLVREYTGQNYSEYIIEIRMLEAQRLLIKTNTPINQIASCVGYERANSFYKSFIRFTGMSPNKYRVVEQKQ